MRALIVLSLLTATVLAGCTGTPDTEPFVASCPSWTEGPGKPGAQVASSRHISQQDGELKEFHLEGDFVHHPPTGKYVLDERTLDFINIEFPAKSPDGKLSMYAVDGTYTIRAYRTDMDTNAANHTGADRGSPLFFRDLSAQGQQYKSTITIAANEDLEWDDMNYRIEFSAADQPVSPSSLWIEYEFKADLDNDDSTASQGGFKYSVTFWYRQDC